MRSLSMIATLALIAVVLAHPGHAAAEKADVSATLDALREATVAGDLDAVMDFYAPDAAIVSPFGAFAGRAAIHGFYEQFLATNPGLSVTFIDRTVAFNTEVHRSLVASDTIRMVGVERIIFIETAVVVEGKVVSVTILLDVSDPQTAAFAAASTGG